jgi:hypothetical protein
MSSKTEVCILKRESAFEQVEEKEKREREREKGRGLRAKNKEEY